MASRARHLPIELVIDILSRLPVETLVRSTSVCRTWYALIRSPNFISAHLSRCNHDDYLLISRLNSCYLLCDQTFVEHAEFEVPFLNGSVIVVGSCNGLLCVSNRVGCDVYLWNPSVRKYKNLGSSCLMDDWTDTIVVFGFGFHKPSNDYRVVRIFYFDNGGDVLEYPEIELYSLSTDSWRKIEAMVPCFGDVDTGIFYNGAIHWLGIRMYDYLRDSIMAFDLNDELFQEIMLPACTQDGTEPQMSIMELKGSLSLCVFHSYEDNEEGSDCLCIWMMGEYGVVESWTRQFTVVFEERVGRPLRSTKSGKVIFQEDGLILYSCDLENLQCKIVNGPYGVDATFMESLVLLGGGDVPLGQAL